MNEESDDSSNRDSSPDTGHSPGRRLRIVLVLPYFYPHLGGVESHTRGLAEKLAAKGHDVHVVTARHQKDLTGTEEMDGFILHRVKMFKNIFLTPIIPAVKKVLSGIAPDIVHVHSPPPLTDYYTAKYCKRHDVPFILTYHCDLEIPVFGGRGMVTLYRWLIGRYPIKKADALIYTSRSYAATSHTLWDREGVVIPNAVDVDVFRPDINGSDIRERYGLGNAFVALYVGRLVHHKGLESLILSAKYTSDSIRYFIIGEGDMFPRLEKLARQEGVEDKIVLAGRVKNDDLPRCYAACDCLVLPSLSRLEAFGIVGLEAMASGKPVILASIPGVREVIEDHREGIMCEPADPEDIAAKIMLLADSPRLCRSMGKRGRSSVLERFRWKKIVNDIEKLYYEVLDRRSERDKK